MNMKVLLLEDDPFFANQIVNVLCGERKITYQVEHKATAGEAIEYLQSNIIDIAIIDLNLPDSKGLDTFIKIHQAQRDIPVIILSGDEDELLALRAVKIGAQDYLMKRDVKSNLLIRAIHYAIQRRLERKQAEQALKNSAEELKNRNEELSDANKKLQIEIANRKKAEEDLKISQSNLNVIMEHA